MAEGVGSYGGVYSEFFTELSRLRPVVVVVLTLLVVLLNYCPLVTVLVQRVGLQVGLFVMRAVISLLLMQ